MPYKIEKVDKGYKVCKIDDSKCFSKKPLTFEKAQKQLKAIEINEYENDLKNKFPLVDKVINNKKTSTNVIKFKNQLKEIDLSVDDYLKMAQFIAKNRGYDPKKLKISIDGIHKLNYDGINFGRVNYNDKIIYTWLEHNNKIPEGTAKRKYINYRKRAEKVMKQTNNKYSRASLSFYILW
jgi:hypothetical protein